MKKLLLIAALLGCFFALWAETAVISNDTAKLEFRVVHEDSDRLIARKSDEFKRKNPNGGETEKKLFLKTNAPGGHELLSFSGTNLNGDVTRRYYYVSKKVEMDGEDVSEASVGKDQWGSPLIRVLFNPRGSRNFAELTGKNVGRQLAIVINSRLCCTPYIRAAITGGDIAITGPFTEEEANSLVKALTGKKQPCDIRSEL